MLNELIKNKILQSQKNEITEHYIYKYLSKLEKGKNSEILKKISEDEKKHYNIWKKYTNKGLKPNKLKILKYSFLARLAGITFAIKLMEGGEEKAQKTYEKVIKALPETLSIFKDEEKHEKELIRLIDEEKLNYIGSMVLGLNDALVELTGTIAGLSFALQNTRLISVVGLITGIAAALSMASSEYLSTKSEANGKNPLKASFYTGIAYVIAVIAIILPYFIFSKYQIALAFTLISAVLIILFFSFFMSVIKEQPLKKRFFEMAGISLGVAAISFLIGLLVRMFIGVDV